MRYMLLAAAALIATPALADTPGADWMPEQQVQAQLAAAGYQYVTPLEADDGQWEGMAVHDGKIVEFKADPRTGKVVWEAPKRGS